MKILITGASGLIGSMLARLLRGHELICLVRDANRIDQSIDAKYIVGDIRYDLTPYFKGMEIDTIYHLAALNPLIRDLDMQRDVNINGMKSIIEVAKVSNARSIVYAQGMGVFDAREIDEESIRRPYTEFGRIRLEAERILLDEKDRFDICIPILGDVYGNKGWFMDMIVKRLREKRFMIPGDGEYYRSFVHVYDAANALRILGEEHRDGYYIVCDDHPTKFVDFVYYVADKLGVKHPRKIPEFIARIAIGSEMLMLLTRSVKASNKRIKEIGFTLRFPDYKHGIDEILS